MNEVNKIHLGRQAYTIAHDAHKKLRDYIEAIKKQVKESEVIEEVEVRMSELLTERGITVSKVILMKDVDYLKSQLGSPSDFSDNEESETIDSPSESRRLFRDTDGAIIAGVASGLAKYFGIDILLVRILFVILLFVTFGWGILVYILLWLLIPEAKTSSEKLQMEGKAVNVQSLKEVVKRADVKGTAKRMNRSLAGPINNIFNLILKVVGVGFVAFGLAGLLGLMTAETYYLAQGNSWSKNNIFPVGFREHLLLDITLVVAALISIMIILFGIAIFRRKWPIKVWVTGVLSGLLFIGLAVGGALTADVYPTVHSAYNSNLHSSVRSLKPFTNLSLDTYNLNNLDFVNSDKYMVALDYYGHPNLSTIKTSVKNGTLTIDDSSFNWHRNCSTICLPSNYQLSITIYSPNALQLANQYTSAPEPPIEPMPVYK